MNAIALWRRGTYLFKRLRHRSAYKSAIYFLGRFYVVRRSWYFWNTITTPFVGDAVLRPVQLQSVEPFDEQIVLAAIKSDSAFGFIQLNDPTLHELQAAAQAASRFDAHGQRQEIDATMLEAHEQAGNPVLIADCKSAAVQVLCDKVARDPQLMSLAHRFLGRGPRHIELRLQESLVAQASIAFRESKNQTVQFHYDVQSLNFLYVFFYLTDTNRTTGSHELMRGTHKGKKLRHLLASARAQDEDVYSSYGSERAWIMEGKAGQGFVEDTSCFHRALAPLQGNRLALQIRYS